MRLQVQCCWGTFFGALGDRIEKMFSGNTSVAVMYIRYGSEQRYIHDKIYRIFTKLIFFFIKYAQGSIRKT